MRCPAGHLMKLVKAERNPKTNKLIKKFKGTKCPRCKFAAMCTSGYCREYEYQAWWELTKERIKKRFYLKRIKEVYSRRKMDVETVIGNIKHNLNFKKFLLRGLRKVNIEAGLISIAHNLIKILGFRRKLAACGT